MTASRADGQPFTVRPAEASELASVGALCVAAYRAGGHLPDDDPYTAVLLDAAARAEQGEVLVLTDAQGLAGTVTICPPGTAFAEICVEGEFEFRFLAVDPSRWGSGIGAALVAACDQRAREIGATAIVICVISNNTAALAMYERLRFSRMPDRDWSPRPGINLLALTRPVSP